MCQGGCGESGHGGAHAVRHRELGGVSKVGLQPQLPGEKRGENQTRMIASVLK